MTSLSRPRPITGSTDEGQDDAGRASLPLAGPAYDWPPASWRRQESVLGATTVDAPPIQCFIH